MTCLIYKYQCQWRNVQIDNHVGSQFDDHYYNWYRHFISYYDLDSSNKLVHDSLFVFGTGTTIKDDEVKLIYVPKSDLSMELRIKIRVLTC